MIPRDAEATLAELASGFPVVGITGPRQSGKTTLAQAVFAAKPYVSLEDPDVREFATEDPRGFLASYPDGAVLDEAQWAPALFSYLQGRVDASRVPGQFILRGHDVDLVFERAGSLQPVEIKAGATIGRDAFKGLQRWQELAGETAVEPQLIYAGDEARKQRGIAVRPWRDLANL